ncbi:hypothetical protein VMCG_05268 [Cytospora schulzeri]|uniref:Uncharacterized protein n=1 Tax=Cytospora schulzeri TaxID=448051 RepID=A0A423WR76_9PEZI|nr:hypothetical protein VMCG_05268 [Valsa malicola]
MTRNPPQTSAVPNPASVFALPTSQPITVPQRTMTETSTAGPTPTPLPNIRRKGGEDEKSEDAGRDNNDHHHDGGGDDHKDTFPLPKLRLHIQDITHPGASRFLSAIDASTILPQSVETVLKLLYVSNRHEVYKPPPTRSVTVFLEDMGGVAYTKGTDLDNDHKEIHMSLNYIKGIKEAPEGADGDVTGAYEIRGVLVHELVHCFQYNGKGACPGGFVEGIADWVRLAARLGAPHWKRGTVPERWDQGYERTAYFLDWLENVYGKGTVRKMNEELRVRKYKQSEFWVGLLGSDIDALWEEYLRVLKKQ